MKQLSKRTTTDSITTEAELDARLEELQNQKLRRHIWQARLRYYDSVATLVIIGLLIIGYLGWPWISAGRSDQALDTLEAVRNLFVFLVVVRAFDYSVDRISTYRRATRA